MLFPRFDKLSTTKNTNVTFFLVGGSTILLFPFLVHASSQGRDAHGPDLSSQRHPRLGNQVLLINKTTFRPVSRQQKDRFRNKLFCCLACRFLPPLVSSFLPTFLGYFENAVQTVCCTFLGGGGVLYTVMVKMHQNLLCL